MKKILTAVILVVSIVAFLAIRACRPAFLGDEDGKAMHFILSIGIGFLAGAAVSAAMVMHSLREMYKRTTEKKPGGH